MEYNIWLSRVKISNESKIELMDYFGGIKDLFNYVVKDKNNKNLINSDVYDKLFSAWDEIIIKSDMAKMKKDNIFLVRYDEENYPEKLLNIKDFPVYLYYKGDIKSLNKMAAAVVGSRECTSYGRDAAMEISSILRDNNISIISGMARGIDGIAHREALNGGFTCAVLGCGIDVVYPKENKDIYKLIGSSGCLVSEFPLGEEPNSYNFPYRNRIISGLSELVIVVEGNEKSGSLITAGTALDQGKEVMAVPGSIYSFKSQGPNKLIKEGADPYTKPEDLYQALKLTYEYKEDNIHNNYTNKEKALLKFLDYSPLHIDEIIRKSNIDIKDLYRLLFDLQMKNAVECVNGSFYIRLKS